LNVMAPQDDAEVTTDALAEDEADAVGFPDATWSDICQMLRLEDTRMEKLLTVFTQRYEIDAPSAAFTSIPRFLGEYLVSEFDYKAFCLELGLFEASESDDDWTAYMGKHLKEDLVSAASLMLRCATAIAKTYDLRDADWKDVNEACCSAIRDVPNCYRLQRVLPGGLSVVRAWRFLPQYAAVGGNPWQTDEGKSHFEKTYDLDWPRVEDATEKEGGIASGFSGCFLVTEVNEVEWISLVTLEAVLVNSAPVGFPEKSISVGDKILWEVESSLGRLLEPGLTLEADWYELDNEVCFMGDLTSVAPHWLHSAAS